MKISVSKTKILAVAKEPKPVVKINIIKYGITLQYLGINIIASQDFTWEVLAQVNKATRNYHKFTDQKISKVTKVCIYNYVFGYSDLHCKAVTKKTKALFRHAIFSRVE